MFLESIYMFLESILKAGRDEHVDKADRGKIILYVRSLSLFPILVFILIIGMLKRPCIV